MIHEEIFQMEPGPELDRLVAERVMGNLDLIRPQLKEGAKVLVRCSEYDGWAIFKGFNDDDTCDVLIEGTSRKLRVHCNQIIEVVGQSPWSPSTDIAAAWEVVENLVRSGWCVDVYIQSPEKYSVSLDKEGYGLDVEASTLPLAICQAALLAVGVGDG